MTNLLEANNFSLLIKCMNGSRESQHQLYLLISPAMYTLCIENCETVEDATEVLTKGFVTLFKSIHTFHLSDSFASWCTHLFKHEIIKYYYFKQLQDTASVE
jgi:DNA-directed RNA polymerase specialized sigma24 family protein